MIKFELYDNLNIQINTSNYEYLKGVDEQFSYYKEGFKFTTSYKMGRWDGKVHLLDKTNRTLPYGLFPELLRYTKKEWKDEGYKIDPEIKNIYGNANVEIIYDLNLYPYDYQADCIESALEWGRGTFRISTGGGKSLIIAYILKALSQKVDQQLIIVPTTSLIKQFYNDLIDYGFDKENIGVVYSDYKQFDYSIVISTWQSLNRRLEELSRYETVVVDECLNGETKIRTINGYKKIKDIVIGEKIFSFNEESKKFEKDIVINKYENLQKSINEDMYEIELDNGENIEITGNHKILTNNGWKQVKNLEEGEEVIDG